MRVPARLRNLGSWAWHTATAAEFLAILVPWLLLFGGLRPALVTECVLCGGLLAAAVAWKHERRKVWWRDRELKHTQDNARWLQDKISGAREELRALSQAPPRLVSLTVQNPRALGPRPDDESEWPVVPLIIKADSPHDPAATVVCVRLPASAPWHTES